uniref:Uncharacterized protein n=1 Tax=Romanomermis culicivorax TaxID=13658 RepID=A0A915KI17_ROMCU
MFDSDSMQITQIFVVERPEFRELRLVGVRLANGQQISDILKGNGKIRFIFLLFGPPTPNLENYDVGRALGVMFTNK